MLLAGLPDPAVLDVVVDGGGRVLKRVRWTEVEAWWGVLRLM